MSRSETRRLAALLDLPFVDDPQNDDLSIRRNRLRTETIPALAATYNPGLHEALLRTARAASADDEALEERATRVPLHRDEEAVLIPAAALTSLPAAVAARVVRRGLRMVSGRHSVDGASVEAVISAAFGAGVATIRGGFDVRRGPLGGGGRFAPTTAFAGGVDRAGLGAVRSVEDHRWRGWGAGSGGRSRRGARRGRRRSHLDRCWHQGRRRGVAGGRGAGASPPPVAGGRRAWKNRLGGRNPGGAGDRRRGPDVGDEGVAVRVKSVLVTREQIATRLHELGAEITADYQGKDLLLVAILKGAFMVMADLAREIALPVDIDFMAVSSYGHATQTSGVVRILKDLDSEIAGRHVLIVEDIIDSGLTLDYLRRNLEVRQPASLEIATLLLKKDIQRVPLRVRYVGFEIPRLRHRLRPGPLRQDAKPAPCSGDGGGVGTRHQAPGTRHQAPGTRHQASGTRHQAPGTRHQAPGIRQSRGLILGATSDGAASCMLQAPPRKSRATSTVCSFDSYSYSPPLGRSTRSVGVGGGGSPSRGDQSAFVHDGRVWCVQER